MDSINNLKDIFKKIHDQIEKRLDFDCFYIVFYRYFNQRIDFPFVIDKGKKQEWPSRNCQFNEPIPPIDFVIKNREILSIDRNFIWTVENQELIFWPDNDPAVSWLGIPLISGNQIIGVLAVENRSETKIWNKDDIDFLSLVAAQLTNKIRDILIHRRKIVTFEALQFLSQKLTSDIRLIEQEILDLIYKQATRLMDTSNMYIAMYDPDPDWPDIYDPQSPEKNEIHGTIRFDLMYIDNEKKHLEPRKARKGEYGRTEVIISTREPIINATKDEAEKWYYRQSGHKEFIGQTFASWIGVPMITSGGRVVGVIATYHKEFEYLYDDEHLQVLKMMAAQAATAIDNIRTYRLLEEANAKLEERVNITEKQKEALTELLSLNDLAGRFVHKVNNLAGNIPIDTDFIKEAILEKGIHDRSILDDLNGIKKQAQDLVDMARRVQQSTAKLKRTGKILEKADAVFLMNKALVHTTGGKETPRHQIIKDYKVSPLMIETFESLFTEALSNIISNALDAMPNGGKLTLSSEIILNKARLGITDTGTGIPKEDIEKIYDIDYSKKTGGLGYGLWSVRRICDAVGADIKVESEIGKGTSFYLEIPLAE